MGRGIIFSRNAHLKIEDFTFVGGNLVTWMSKKCYSPVECSIYCVTNKVAIAISQKPLQHDHTKHVEIDRHFS
ncbi:hypothetical protein OSB04_030963 [Centaurea solstitialis]|uniref:Uncharacterized protein n=1 Tax=Centaurea solstitialis TaxID=347529 RepID=A0AA38S8M0_9ASTR|nr:hypothetical protein OSB04_030963 [Centaurea solstitialis]